MSEGKNQEERIHELESMIAHLQHDYDKLNSAMIDLDKVIREIHKRIDHLDGRVTNLSEGPENRTLEDEKPPHY